MYVFLLIHSSVHAHLGCFHFLALKPYLNTYLQSYNLHAVKWTCFKLTVDKCTHLHSHHDHQVIEYFRYSRSYRVFP